MEVLGAPRDSVGLGLCVVVVSKGQKQSFHSFVEGGVNAVMEIKTGC